LHSSLLAYTATLKYLPYSPIYEGFGWRRSKPWPIDADGSPKHLINTGDLGRRSHLRTAKKRRRWKDVLTLVPMAEGLKVKLRRMRHTKG